MTRIVHRLRIAVRSLGNEGAVANAAAELRRTAAANAAVDRLELRLAPAVGAPMPDAA